MYTPPPPPKKRFPLWAGLLLGCGCLLFVVPAILIAILIPVFSQAREKARSASCLSNIKQTTLASNMYAQDWDQTFPRGSTWMTQIQPYTGNSYVFHCPVVSHRSFSAESQTSPEQTTSKSQAWDGIFGYAYNSDISDKNLAKVDAPATTALIYDSSTLTENAADPFTSLPSPPRHSNGGTNGNAVGFVDGHAKFNFQDRPNF